MPLPMLEKTCEKGFDKAKVFEDGGRGLGGRRTFSRKSLPPPNFPEEGAYRSHECMSTAWEAVKSSTEKTSRLSTPENPVFQRGCITSSTNSGGMSRSDLWSRGRGPNRRDRFLSASFSGAFCWPLYFAASASLPRGSRPCRWMTRTRGSHAASTGAGSPPSFQICPTSRQREYGVPASQRSQNEGA